MANFPINPILPLNLIFGLVLFQVALGIYVVPNLSRWSPVQLLTPILLLHGFRELGLMFMYEGASLPGIPLWFAVPASLGDLIAAVLAVIALIGVRQQLDWAKQSVWIFNLWGIADLFVAIALAVVFQAGPFLGAAYWIPAFWVPLLLATHILVFRYLTKHWQKTA